MRNCLVAGFALLGGVLFAAPSVTEVTARQRYPWNGLVDISCTAGGVEAGKNKATVTVTDLAAGTNVTVATLSVAGAAVENGAFSLGAGANQILWDAQKDLPKDYLSERMKVDVSVVPYSFSVKFNANGGTGTMANESFEYGTAKALTANAFTRTGYTFSGWATSASGAKAYSDKQSVSNLAATENAAVNLYAVWTANTYSVKFNANGGTGTMANESFTYGTAKALSANVFKRTGYTFSGWATSATGAVKYTDKQSVSDLASAAGATVNLYAVWKGATYMVIDLSAGANATSYPVTYLDVEPSGGFNVDAYKTTKLVLKRLAAGSFKMQGSTTTTLTKPFYMGLFEVTQKQWTLVMGSNPSSSHGVGDAYPVYYVSYNMIRGSSEGAKWPSSAKVDASSFLGKLQARTGINFDLPTEAQWEYACRAGTTTTYYWGSSMNGDYAWYSSNSGSNTHPVGGKKPNAWGLYDMNGNVWEWNLDWLGTLAYGTDPKGSASGSGRVTRGGGWSTTDSGCTSSYRFYCNPSSGSTNGYGLGFRLSRTLP